MSDEVIFKELPETFPKFDKYKKPAAIVAVVFHVVLISVLIIIPLLMPQRISQTRLVAMLVSTLGPPPAPLPPPVFVRPAGQPVPPKPRIQKVTSPDALVMPIAVPKEVARVVEAPIVPDTGVVGGVPGGVPGGIPGGVTGGIIGSILSANSNANPLPAVAPPLPPPPPPKAAAPAEPVRVGGVVREPRVAKLVPPIYPKLARQARVQGTVVLEAIVTAEGKVAEIKVISGHPLLVDAAIDCVKKWEYEPTLLNGVPTAVILTAKVHFQTAPLS
jgi:periplasmic protein TonB